MDRGIDRDARFVPVAEFSQRHEADLVRALLESEGVPAAVRGEGAGGFSLDVGLSSGVAVLVPERELAHARELLRSALETEANLAHGERPAPTGPRSGGGPSMIVWLTAAVLLAIVAGMALLGGSPLG